MNTEIIWDEEVVADNDVLIAAIEEDIAATRAKLSRLSENEDQDDILFI